MSFMETYDSDEERAQQSRPSWKEDDDDAPSSTARLEKLVDELHQDVRWLTEKASELEKTNDDLYRKVKGMEKKMDSLNTTRKNKPHHSHSLAHARTRANLTNRVEKAVEAAAVLFSLSLYTTHAEGLESFLEEMDGLIDSILANIKDRPEAQGSPASQKRAALDVAVGLASVKFRQLASTLRRRVVSKLQILEKLTPLDFMRASLRLVDKNVLPLIKARWANGAGVLRFVLLLYFEVHKSRLEKDVHISLSNRVVRPHLDGLEGNLSNSISAALGLEPDSDIARELNQLHDMAEELRDYGNADNVIFKRARPFIDAIHNTGGGRTYEGAAEAEGAEEKDASDEGEGETKGEEEDVEEEEEEEEEEDEVEQRKQQRRGTALQQRREAAASLAAAPGAAAAAAAAGGAAAATGGAGNSSRARHNGAGKRRQQDGTTSRSLRNKR